jgi:hypothetical protein
MKSDWGLSQASDGHKVITRYQTPLWLWLLDKWFRIPDAIFDRIEWWFPRTSRVTRIPCLLYARWFPELVIRCDWTTYDVETPAEPNDDPDPGEIRT